MVKQALSHLSVYCNETYHITHYQVHVTLTTFSRSWFKAQGYRQHFLKMHFLGAGIQNDSAPSKTI